MRARRLQRLSERLFSGGAHADDPLVAAVTHTARRYRISSQLFADFLASMRMDLTVTDYPDREALNRYMRGSAEAIGLQVLPILGTVTPVDEAAPYAAAWAGRSSSPTSCATSTKIWRAAGCTCRRTNLPPTASTGSC